MHVEVALGVLVVILLVVALVLDILAGRQYSQIPSIPGRLPFVGNAWRIDISRSHIVLSKWAKKLGPIFRFNLYGEEIVVLSDYETIVEALVTNGRDVAGRPPMYRTSRADRSAHSIVWQTYTPKLVFLRKEAMKSLKAYGTGLEKLEEKCAPEILKLLDDIHKKMDQPFDPWDGIYDAVCSVMLNLIIGTSSRSSSLRLGKLKQINKMFNRMFGSGSARLLDYFPWLNHFYNTDHKDLHIALDARDQFWTEELQCLKDADQGVVNSLLVLVQQSHNQPFSITENTAKEVFTNLILAGTDTTSVALTCLLLFLLHHPEVQEKMYNEVVEVAGKCRLPALADKRKMPYTEATLLELLRIIAHVPLAVPHYTVCDTSIQGKRVPASTTVHINLWALLHDESMWGDPWTFRPDRFLSPDKTLLPPSHPVRRRMLAFGAGRRVCLGEAMAKNRLFLFATALIQNFKFEPVESGCLPEADPRTYEMGLVLHPKMYKLCARTRRDGCVFMSHEK